MKAMTIRLNTLLVSWYEGVYLKDSVGVKMMTCPWQVYIKDSVVVGNVDDHCEKNDNYSAIDHLAWMMNTLFDIDWSAQYEPSI